MLKARSLMIMLAVSGLGAAETPSPSAPPVEKCLLVKSLSKVDDSHYESTSENACKVTYEIVTVRVKLLDGDGNRVGEDRFYLHHVEPGEKIKMVHTSSSYANGFKTVRLYKVSADPDEALK